MARNKYGGVCYECGKYTPPGYGHFEKYYNMGTLHWRVHCVKCTSGRIVKDTDKEVVRIRKEIK